MYCRQSVKDVLHRTQFNGGGGSRTPVRKPVSEDVYMHSPSLEFRSLPTPRTGSRKLVPENFGQQRQNTATTLVCLMNPSR